MKRISIILLLISIFLAGCATYRQGKNIESHNDNVVDNSNVVEVHEVETASDLFDASANNEQLPIESQMWKDAYAQLLKDVSGNDFYLCDIDNNGIPELLIGGPSTDTDKYAEFNVYTYKGSEVECLGIVSTVRSSSLWLDDNGGILGYSYGAGAGEVCRYYIDDDILSYDGEVSGYYYDSGGSYLKWFRGTNGNEIIVTEENRYEYEHIWSSMHELKRYIVSDDTIFTVIYGGEY